MIRFLAAIVVVGCSLNYSPALPPSIDGSLEKLNVTEYEHKQCYQHFLPGDAVHNGLAHIDILLGSDGIRPGGPRSNPHEFPWVHTAGHAGKRKHYASIPDDIEWWTEQGNRVDNETVYRWRYPVGTVFVEELLVDERVFEVRIKRKLEGDRWQGVRYNPWESGASLRQTGNPLSLSIRNPKLELLTLKTPHTYPAFQPFTVKKEILPPIARELRDHVLSQPMVPHADWKKDTIVSADDDHNIVPRGYFGHAFPSGNKSCMTCHEQTNTNVFDIQDGRDWYGRIRGSDGIFSFHIFDDESVGMKAGDNRPVKLNPTLPLKRVQK